MGDPSGVAKCRTPQDQNIEIKKAVQALGKNNDPDKLLSLLASCASEKEKQEVLKEFQNQFRQKYDKEVKIVHDPKTDTDLVTIKKWTAQEVDREALSTAATHVVAKLWKNPKAKVEVDEWLQKYSLDNPGGKLDWMKEYCKNTLGQDVVLSKVHTPKGDRIVASLRGELTLPSVPKAPIPTALKRDIQKTQAELQQEANKPLWDKIEDAVLDEAAELATVSSEVTEEISKGEFSKAVDKASTYVSEKFDQAVTAVTNTASDIWEGTKEITQSLGQKIGFISVPEEVETEKPDVITEIDEESGNITFKIEVEANAEEPQVALSNKPALKLPKIPTEVERDEVEEAVTLSSAKSTSATSILLPERPTVTDIEVAEYRATNRSINTDVTPQLESSLNVLDLPVQRSAYIDLMTEAVKAKVKEALDEWEEWEEEEARKVQRPQNAISTVIESLRQDAPVLAAQAAAEKREEHVEQFSRQATAMVAPGVTPTASSIQAAELALLAMVDAKASAFEIERIRLLIRGAKARLEKKEAEEELKDKRVFSV